MFSLDQDSLGAECLKWAQAMNIRHTPERKDKNFTINLSVDAGMVYIRVLLSTPDESFYYPVEARVQYRQNDIQQATTRALLLLDYIDQYFLEFFKEEEELFLPIEWQEHQMDDCVFQLRGQILNRQLEKLADEWLNGKGPH